MVYKAQKIVKRFFHRLLQRYEPVTGVSIVLGSFGAYAYQAYNATGQSILLSLYFYSVLDWMAINLKIGDPLNVSPQPSFYLASKKLFSVVKAEFKTVFLALFGSLYGLTNFSAQGLAKLLLMSFFFFKLNVPYGFDLVKRINRSIKRNLSNPIFVAGILGEIFITYSILKSSFHLIGNLGYQGVIYIIPGLIWFFSGVARVVLENTEFIFENNMNTVTEAFKFYGSTRLLFFVTTTMALFSAMVKNFGFFYILPAFFFIVFLCSFPAWFVLPYKRPSKEVSEVLKVLKSVDKNGVTSKNSIISETELDRDFVENTLDTLSGKSYWHFRPLNEHKGGYYSLKSREKFKFDGILYR
jgi:hypothetical protein